MPQASKLPEQFDGYAVHEVDWQAPEGEGPRSFGISCPVCKTRLVATLDEVGQEIECPDCGKRVLVHEPPPPPPKPVLCDPEDIYAVFGIAQPPPTARQFYERHFPVLCGKCMTRMLATLDQVGQALVCPDCGNPTLVPRPRETAVYEEPARDPNDIYAVAGAEGLAADSPALARHYAYRCPVCHTRLYATYDEAARETTCPDCSKQFVIPPPPKDSPEPLQQEEPVENYDVGAPVERSAPMVPRYVVSKEADAQGSSAGPEEEMVEEFPEWLRPDRARPVLPRHPFLSGVFLFPLYRGAWGRWLGLTAGLVLILCLVNAAIGLSQIDDPGSYFAAMALGAIAVVLGLIWFVVASAFLLAILRDTAEGVSTIVNWPGEVFADWMLHFLNIFVAAAISTGLGMAMAWALRAAGIIPWPAIGLTVYFLFPFFLLSVLEAGSPIAPLSLAVLGSLRWAWLGWIVFYFESAFVVAAMVGAMAALVLIGGWLALPVAILTTGLLFIYFRLLGRLAWYTAERMRGER